ESKLSGADGATSEATGSVSSSRGDVGEGAESSAVSGAISPRGSGWSGRNGRSGLGSVFVDGFTGTKAVCAAKSNEENEPTAGGVGADIKSRGSGDCGGAGSTGSGVGEAGRWACRAGLGAFERTTV